MRIFSLLVAILWCISGDAVAGGAVVSTAPTNNTSEDTILGGAVVSTAPDYPDTDRSVQLRQLHLLQQQPQKQQPQKQHPIRENALMLG
ncbi:MAG: hypothetical protein SO104_03385, partial [Prevotella sp.]|nr:hypothetical protein [Prevotella sp.]